MKARYPVIGGLVGTAALAAGFIAYHEGYVPTTYADPIGIPTACWGHTGADVEPGREYTPLECRGFLISDLHIASDAVHRCIKVPLTEGQKVALYSFTFNVGSRALCTSTLARMANAGHPPEMWCAQLSRWHYAGGRSLPGLVKRRAEERAWCEGQVSPDE